MVVAYDNWERLVRATLLREELRQIARQCSSASSISWEFPQSFHSIFLNLSKTRKQFEYEQILKATDGFADKNIVKQGHSGDLFRGELDSSTSVFIKRIDLRLVHPYEYLSELEFYSKITHSGFVHLLGYCFEDENIEFLVYEYVPNGDLSSFSFKKPNGNVSLKLRSWRTRMQIAIGAAKALVYLHHEFNPPLVHGDVQASSILLDDNFNVKLGSLSRACDKENTLLDRITRAYQEDTYYQEASYQENTSGIGSWASDVYRFGKVLVKLVTRKQGINVRSDVQSIADPMSSGIMKLIYEDTSGIAIGSCESDVYCFGKVLLELVTGEMGISAKSDVMAQDWFKMMLLRIEDNETNIIDSSLLISDVSEFENVWAVAALAKSCLDPVPSSRPQMKSVLRELEDFKTPYLE